MSYAFSPHTSLADNLRQVTDDQLHAARDELMQLDSAEAVHQTRKRCKKMRALLRLIRYTDADSETLYQVENALYRSISDLLCSSRDAVSLYQALAEQLDVTRYPHITAFLRVRIVEDDKDTLLQVRQLLNQHRKHMGGWKIDHLTWKDSRQGYAKSYRRTKKALKDAQEKEDDVAFHTLRKRVKDQWYHSRLLQKRYPKKIGRRCKPLKALASALGDWRDLRLLCHFLALNSANLEPDARAELIPLLDQAQQRLQVLRKEIDRLSRQQFAGKKSGKQKKCTSTAR